MTPSSHERHIVTRGEEAITDEDIAWSANSYPPGKRTPKSVESTITNLLQASSKPRELSGEEKAAADEDVAWNLVNYPPGTDNHQGRCHKWLTCSVYPVP